MSIGLTPASKFSSESIIVYTCANALGFRPKIVTFQTEFFFTTFRTQLDR